MTYTEKLQYLLSESKNDMRPYRIREDVEAAIKQRLMIHKIPIIRANPTLGHRGTVGAVMWALVARLCPGDGAIHARLKRLIAGQEDALMSYIAGWEPDIGEVQMLGRILSSERRGCACLDKFKDDSRIAQ